MEQTIADKLLLIAENQTRVFEAGESTERKKTDESLGGSVSSVEQAVDDILEAQDNIIEGSPVADIISRAYTEGITEGREVERKAIWGAIQSHGNRTDYGSAFAGSEWDIETFRPAYDMRPILAASMFARLNNSPSNAPQIDFVELAEKEEIIFDFSNCTNVHMAFATGGISRLGVIDLKSATSINYAFYGAYNTTQGLRSIEKLICYETNTFQPTTFQGCYFLSDLTIDGVIASSINFSDCPLSLESAKSVIMHLKNLYQNGVGYSQTILFSEYTWEQLDEDYANGGGWVDSSGLTWPWQRYLTEGICWNISQ